MKKYDYLIVGSGFFGATCANLLSKKENKILVIDKRNNIFTFIHKVCVRTNHTNQLWASHSMFASFLSRLSNQSYNIVIINDCRSE